MERAELASRLAVAIKIAKDAGAILEPGWRERPAFRTKSTAVDLVTEYDERSEALVVGRLMEAYPHDNIVGEEGTRITGRADAPIWHIDPVDGTANFAHGVPMFAVSIGLCEPDAGEPVVGVVHAPALGYTFSGGRGLGARLNDAPISVSSVNELQASILATGFPNSVNPVRDNFAEFAALTGHVHGTRRLGSAALDLAFVACGWFDGFWERQIKSWDLVGGAAIVLAAGGRVTDVDGGPFVADGGRILATNGHIHEALSAALERVARDTGRSFP